MTPPPAHLGPHYDSVPALPPDEAERWVKLAHRGLWASWVLAGLWVVVYAALFVLAPDETICTDAEPCTDSWPMLLPVTAGIAAALLAPVAVVRFPVLGLAFGLIAAVVLPTDPDLASYPSWVPVLEVAVVIGTCAVSAVRVRSRWEQRAIVRRHAVTVPGIHLPKQNQGVAGWVLVAGGCALVAVALTAYTAYRDHQWDQHAERAAQVRGTVTDHDSDGYVITVDVGAEEVEIDTWDATMYPVGSEVSTLVDDDWSALAADPYDPTMVALALGPLLCITGLAAYGGMRVRRSLARLRAPHPALRVDVMADGTDVLISAYPDVRHLGRLSVVRKPAHRLDTADDLEDWGEDETDAWEDWEDEEDVPGEDRDDWDEDGWHATYAALRTPEPAVLHGDLAISAAPTLVVFPRDAEPVVLWADGLVAVPIDPPWRARLLRAFDSVREGAVPDSQAGDSWTPGLPTTQPREPSTELSLRQPVAVGTPTSMVSLTATALLALVALGMWLVNDGTTTIYELAGITFGELVIASGAFRVVTWRAQIDAEGIVARVGLTKLRVSWDEIRAVPAGSPGTLLTRDREVAMLLPVPAGPARLFTKGGSERLIQSVEAIHRDPSLRPITVLPDPPPLIPELIVGLAGIPVAVNLAAWFLTR